jgi:hypothetical protein
MADLWKNTVKRIFMQIFTIADPDDRSFPLTQEVFGDRTVLYHGSWSTYSPVIETAGLLSGAVTFDLSPFISITEALQAIGVGSFFSGFEGYGKQFSSREVFFSANFWAARAYATDAGGEVVRMTIKDATTFEQICIVPEERSRLICRWETGLQTQPDHALTRDAIAVLKNNDQMRKLYANVLTARQQLLALFEGGHAVVHAVRVEPSWFGDRWTTHIRNWEEMDSGGTELWCRFVEILPNRLIGRVDYPNGTDASFDPTHITTWREVEALSHSS